MIFPWENISAATVITGLLKVLVYAVLLRFSTLSVKGNPATWVSAVITAVLAPILFPVAFLIALTVVMPILVQLGPLATLAFYAIPVLVFAVCLQLFLRTEARGEAPGFGPSVIIAIVLLILGSIIDYAADKIYFAILSL